MGGYGPPGRQTGGGYCAVWFICIALLPLLMLTSCATPVVIATPSSCAALLPESWRQGVEGAPLPEGNTVADWIVFGDAQTGKLDQANGRTVDAIGIVERCEARDRAAIKPRGFFARLFGN